MNAYQVVGRGRCRTRKLIGFLYYADAPSHQHWHLWGFERYSLVRGSGSVEAARKAGFCVGDTFRVLRNAQAAKFSRPQIDFCQQRRPKAVHVLEGLTPGWADYYAPTREGQYVALTGLRDGTYTLVNQVDPTRRIAERQYGYLRAGVVVRLVWAHRSHEATPSVTIVGECQSTQCYPIRPVKVPRATQAAANG